MREPAARLSFSLCLVLGWLVRAARYSKVQVADRHGERLVRKHRVFYAPLLIWLGNLLVTVLNAGVRVLSQQEWEERERDIYHTLYNTSIRIDAGGVLVLPRLAGETLAAVLENPIWTSASGRRRLNRRSSPSPRSIAWD